MNVKDSLLKAFAQAGRNYISGSALAEQLGVSRNAVWKAVKALESEGYIIDSVTARATGSPSRAITSLLSSYPKSSIPRSSEAG